MKYILALVGLAVVLAGIATVMQPTEEAARKQNQQQARQQESALDNYTVDPADMVDAPSLIADITPTELTEAEAFGLAYMREEEKLARDVYQALYEKWGAQVFTNITQSEQTHMDAVLTLLERYNLEDPASTQYGVFTNDDLQTLYTDLVAQGSESLVAAYTVGALIEDLDIRDLEDYKLTTDREDILLVYDNLQRGSRNHLRAFNRQIVKENGENYVPEYISQAEFDAIIGEEVERGPQGGRGRGWQN